MVANYLGPKIGAGPIAVFQTVCLVLQLFPFTALVLVVIWTRVCVPSVSDMLVVGAMLLKKGAVSQVTQ